MLGSSTVLAQTMTVHSDGRAISFNLTNVDSITFSEVEEFEPGDEREFQLNDEVNVTMCWIPAGLLVMGSPNDDNDRYDDEQPVHQVQIETGFWMSKYEVTQDIWETVTGETPSFFDGNDRPVERVSWDDIHEGFLAQVADGFRLPSEAEWEYACRAGTDTRFFWGDDNNYQAIGDYAWYSNNSDSQTQNVGQKRPNAWGLYDMIGNIWEWCEDDYHDNYEGAPENGSPWIDAPRADGRVLRGGSWSRNPRSCRTAYRNWDDPDYRYSQYGLRLVLDR